MARKIVITSGKGGVGKTTFCANLGYKLAAKGLNVLLMDVDLGLNNLDVVMGVENKIVYDLLDVLDNKCRPKQALIQDFNYDNLYILPSTHSYYDKLIDIQKIAEVVNEIEFMFDYILIDCPAGIDGGFVRAISLADEAIVITSPHLSAVRDADKVFSLLNSYNLCSKYLVVNRVRGDLIVEGDMLSVESICDYMSVPLLGVVPEDDLISLQLINSGDIDKGLISTAFEIIAKNLHTGSREYMDLTKKYRGFVGTIRRSIKRKV